MKFAVTLLCLLPVALCFSPQRKFLESFGFPGFPGGAGAFDLDILKCDIQMMLDVLGADPTEAACEGECHKLLQSGQLFSYSCPLVCHGFQNLVHLWHVVPDTTDPSVSKCHPKTPGNV